MAFLVENVMVRTAKIMFIYNLLPFDQNTDQIEINQWPMIVTSNKPMEKPLVREDQA